MRYLIATLTLLATLDATAYPSSCFRRDVNSDGRVNSADLAMVYSCLWGETSDVSCDVDEDGAFTLADVTAATKGFPCKYSYWNNGDHSRRFAGGPVNGDLQEIGHGWEVEVIDVSPWTVGFLLYRPDTRFHIELHGGIAETLCAPPTWTAEGWWTGPLCGKAYSYGWVDNEESVATVWSRRKESVDTYWVELPWDPFWLN